ncbi:glycosyl transferase family 2 [Aureimonas flava]|uniref:Glycosyl transferase family 2 n=1 Tax=Aureimonas flava TaxID=2320271 RepID=A0A3A1WP01_9HYPH|nr:glycosyl transferase family 2 [Aureimonas flava]RIX98820.1 glycosyl transferase family 2 [Aureimonas flava]
MLTVLIHRADDPAALAQTLTPLVAGAVEGVLRDVAVLDAENEDVRRVADHAGCRLAATGETMAGAAGLRGEWVLLVRAGERLPEDWIERVLRHAGGRGAAGAGAVRLPEPRAGVLDRLMPRRRGAVLVSRAALAAASRGGDIDALLRALRPRRMRPGR